MSKRPVTLEEVKGKAEAIYTSQSAIYNPYLKCEIELNSEGFRHLQFSGRRKRSKQDQMIRFQLLPLALDVVRRSATLQEYRRTLKPIGGTSARGETRLKPVEYWAFVAIMGKWEKPVKLRTILRRVGDGNVMFWSVMPYSKFRKGKQRLSMDSLGEIPNKQKEAA